LFNVQYIFALVLASMVLGYSIIVYHFKKIYRKGLKINNSRIRAHSLKLIEDELSFDY